LEFNIKWYTKEPLWEIEDFDEWIECLKKQSSAQKNSIAVRKDYIEIYTAKRRYGIYPDDGGDFIEKRFLKDGVLTRDLTEEQIQEVKLAINTISEETSPKQQNFGFIKRIKNIF